MLIDDSGLISVIPCWHHISHLRRQFSRIKILIFYWSTLRYPY